MVHPAQLSRKMSCQEILGHYEADVEVQHLAGTPYLAGHLPAGTTETSVACTGRSSLSQFHKEKEL